MPGLVPGIHVFLRLHEKEDVDGRDKPGHDGFFLSIHAITFVLAVSVACVAIHL
jgi:hypothetical protein